MGASFYNSVHKIHFTHFGDIATSINYDGHCNYSQQDDSFTMGSWNHGHEWRMVRYYR
ncbi:hypothetical protein SS322685_1262 [Shigella sonnei 3226-85]|uniref:Uncharacterized protein n=1 Tax=Shigella flexneri 2a str. 301 TaxID=198214 RepID=A0AB36P9Z9_SHIFL|nr:hypothetical protein Sd1012_3198 [Shigella dysenteriae 1012]EFZ52533.1 hypothetical protein SS53G_2933 [Shigella sonnei 53G]EGK26756.1 hypothetical protein SFVA6_1128 [Shigella flexneri VA-6]EIQ18113.1 hypothetical protein SFK1770_0925 [Shigella flexneri K-1770]EIQ32380.1 hypothetical protein SFK404_0969 [Shigella flexneri K-404]EIQ46143.1 hypothetical protein SS322685_1262 [Shigella sonnei 3226-85]EIQ52486.1 hypothetical protein SS482266_2175 [Shigella sonnei 4822-66]EIQ76897.1 hypotheti